MRIRRNAEGQTEVFCRRGQHWVETTERNLYVSTAIRRGDPVDEFIPAGIGRTGNTNRWSTICRRCEADRQAERRSNPNRATRRASSRGRCFGVELELTGPSASIIVAALRPVLGYDVAQLGYRATNGDRWELKHDGSVHGHGLELVSPKLRGQAGFDELRSVCFALQSVGATVDSSCGLHVHVDFRNVALESAKRQLLTFVANENLSYAFVAPSRRTNHYAGSNQWSTSQVQALRAIQNGTLRDLYAPRGTVNIGSFARHGSVEFRSAGGSTNYAKISAWIRFIFATLNYGETNGERRFLNASDWVGAVGMTHEDRAQLLRFENARNAAAAQVESDEYAAVSA